MGILQNLFRKVGRGSSTNGRSGAGAREAVATPDTRSRWHIVVSGDSLFMIAKREYGDANDWPKIYWANRKIVQSPSLIHAGQVLRIP